MLWCWFGDRAASFHNPTGVDKPPLPVREQTAAKVNNAAVLQFPIDKSANQFLSTLPTPGQAQFLTVLKPCGLLLPHVHMRASELYTVLYGEPSITSCQSDWLCCPWH